MSAKQCLKCGHTATYEGAPPLACPQCSAIYSKVEEALRGEPLPRRVELQRRESPISERSLDVHAFTEQMRAESLYPAWRKMVDVVTIIWYLLAVVALIVGVVSSKGSFLGILASAGGAAFVALFARIGKELSLMIADLSDAALRLAAHTDSRE